MNKEVELLREELEHEKNNLAEVYANQQGLLEVIKCQDECIDKLIKYTDITDRKIRKLSVSLADIIRFLKKVTPKRKLKGDVEPFLTGRGLLNAAEDVIYYFKGRLPPKHL